MGKLPQVLSVVSRQEPCSVLPLHNPRATTLLHRSTSLHLPVVIGPEAKPCGTSTAAYGSVLEFKCATNQACLLPIAGRGRTTTLADTRSRVSRSGRNLAKTGPQENSRLECAASAEQLAAMSRHASPPPYRYIARTRRNEMVWSG